MPKRRHQATGPLAGAGRGTQPDAELLPYDGLALDTPEAVAEHERGREFIRLFNELDHYIKRLTQSSGGEGFFRRLQWAARDQPQIKRYIDDLMEYSELRNALVHDRRFPNRLIAVPTAETLAYFRRLVERLVRPRRVIPAFASEIRVFDAAEPLAAALQYMHAGGYTQVVVREGGQLRLLTAAGITRWLAAGLDDATSDGSSTGTVGTATIADALAFDKPEAMALIAASATLEEAVDVFQSAATLRRVRLFAIVITQSGESSEAPLGIITPADLLDDD